ncbi:MAG: hypothetical protein N2C11_08720, partial [Planococcus sp. (in: firmicutes)]
KAPSPKLLNFLCGMANGRFITNEKLQEIDFYAKEILELQKKNQILKQENYTLMALNEELKAGQEVEGYEKSSVERSKNTDSSSINGIVKFE